MAVGNKAESMTLVVQPSQVAAVYSPMDFYDVKVTTLGLCADITPFNPLSFGPLLVTTDHPTTSFSAVNQLFLAEEICTTANFLASEARNVKPPYASPQLFCEP